MKRTAFDAPIGALDAWGHRTPQRIPTVLAGRRWRHANRALRKEVSHEDRQARFYSDHP